MLHSPPELFGTFSGFQFSLIGLLQLVVGPAIDMMGLDFSVTFAVLGTTTVVTGCALQLFWRWRPPPGPGDMHLAELIG